MRTETISENEQSERHFLGERNSEKSLAVAQWIASQSALLLVDADQLQLLVEVV
jgi:hypothetical protein